MGQAEGLPVHHYHEVLEGGAIEVNGEGLLLTTEAVLLNPNRPPHYEKNTIEQLLNERLGAREVIWLKSGIVGDDTGGHIDDIARFTTPHSILISDDPHGPNASILEENQRLLQQQFTGTIIKLPMPKACEIPGWRLPVLPASYVNFLITNHMILVPTFRQKANDDRALGIIAEQFPRHEVVGIDALDIVHEGGAIHCISMQQAAHPIS